MTAQSSCFCPHRKNLLLSVFLVFLLPCSLDWLDRENDKETRNEKREGQKMRRGGGEKLGKEQWDLEGGLGDFSQSEIQRLHVSINLLFSVSDPLASFASFRIDERIQKRHVKKQTSQSLSGQWCAPRAIAQLTSSRASFHIRCPLFL